MRSSACSAPSAAPTTSRSPSPSRKACSPRRTTSWSSTTRTPILSSGSGATGDTIAIGRDLRADHGAPARRAVDCELPADLGRTAPHRLEPEVAGVPGGRVETEPVVADFDQDAVTRRLDADPRGRGVRVLHDVG